MSDTAEKIVIVCPSCHKQYRVATALIGKKASCRCGTVIPVESPRPGVPVGQEPAVLQAIQDDSPPVRPPLDDLPWTEEAPPTPVQASPTDCASHPGTPAMFACAECHKLVCRACAFTQHDGRHLCSSCAVASASPSLGGSKALAATIVHGMCLAHHEVPAVVRCRYCNALLCPTCDFSFDNKLHLCARCATTPPQGLGRCRKILLAGSLVTLSLALAGTVVKFALGATLLAQWGALGESFLNALFVYPLLLPSIVGFALAVGSFARRAANPPLIWVALSLNTLMLVFWSGMLLVVLFSSVPQTEEEPEPETPAVESSPEPAPQAAPVSPPVRDEDSSFPRFGPGSAGSFRAWA